MVDINVDFSFQKILDESNGREAKSKGRKPNKIWVDKGSDMYVKNNIFGILLHVIVKMKNI